MGGLFLSIFTPDSQQIILALRLNPGTWPQSKAPMRVLRIVNVEHLVWETGTQLKHKVMLFTEEVDGTEELRLSKEG